MTLTYSSYKKLQKGSRAPEFELQGIDGRKHSLKEFEGNKAVLIIFMCNHCPYVQPKISKLIELDEKYAEKGLAIVGINANDVENYPEDSFEKMKEFAEKHGIKFHYLFDESQNVPRKYGATCTPDPFLFNKELKMEYHGRIDNAHGESHERASTNELEEAITELIETGKVEKTKPLPSSGCNIKWK